MDSPRRGLRYWKWYSCSTLGTSCFWSPFGYKRCFFLYVCEMRPIYVLWTSNKGGVYGNGSILKLQNGELPSTTGWINPCLKCPANTDHRRKSRRVYNFYLQKKDIMDSSLLTGKLHIHILKKSQSVRMALYQHFMMVIMYIYIHICPYQSRNYTVRLFTALQYLSIINLRFTFTILRPLVLLRLS